MVILYLIRVVFCSVVNAERDYCGYCHLSGIWQLSDGLRGRYDVCLLVWMLSVGAELADLGINCREEIDHKRW